MTRPTPAWPVVIVASAAMVGVLTFSDTHTPVRPLVALWFLGICPGMALVRLLRLQDSLVEVAVAIAVSLALDIIVAGLVVYAGAWSTRGILAILIGISLAGVAIQVASSRSDHVSARRVR